MNSDWKHIRLSEVIEIISGGTPKTNLPEYWDGEIPWLSVADFNTGYRWVSNAEKSVTELGVSKSATTVLRKGDIIISARGTVGALAQLSKPMAFNQSCYGIRGKEKVSDTNFVYYALRYVVSSIKRVAHGGVFDTITRDTFKLIELDFPSLPEQRAIAYILGALDDKIELNRKTNEALEAMAQALFKSWFVDFEGITPEDMCESEMGLIPKKWRIGRLEELADIVGGGTPPTSERNFYCEAGTSISWLSPKDLSGYSWKYISQGATDITELGLNNSSARMLPKGTVLFSSRAPIGYIAIAEKEVCTNQGFKSLIPKNGSNSEFLYYLIKENTGLIESSASGSTFREISGSGMKELSVICPPEVLMVSFKKAVSDFFERQKTLRHETNGLIKIRDTLLPKLISGELRIKDIAKIIGDAK